MRKFLSAGVVAAALLAASAASAATTLAVDMTFETGATFSGDVTFSDDFAEVLDVDGTLTGYEEGSFQYTGTGSSHIHFVWIGGLDFDPAPQGYLGFLMSGVDDTNHGSFIKFAYDFSSGTPVLAVGGIDPDPLTDLSISNNVNYVDPMVSGSIGIVPEPATWALMIGGFGLVGGALRRRTAVTA